ncbi:MAG: hypothetical protein JSS04_06520 [Proteobacteria bacterium]|nr:hypothetical protein [Pseudomonadota bacterium]
MRKGIDTVPKNGDFVILEDDGIGKYAIARWSSDAAEWVDEGGTPCGLNPTHWQPFNSGGYISEATDELGAASAKAGQALVRAHRAALRHVRSPRPERPPTRRFAAVRASLSGAGARIRTRLQSWRTTLTAVQGRSRVPVVVAGLGIVALVGGWSYRGEIADFCDRLFVSVTDNALTQARQALREQEEKIRKLAGDLAESRRQVDAGTRSAEGAQRDEVDRLRGELASAKRDIETQTARARAADDRAAKAKEAGDRVIDELRQALQAEVGKAEQLRVELAAAGRETEVQAASARTAKEEAAKAKEASSRTADELRQALGEERDKVEKLRGELAAATREIETQTAKARAADDETAKAKKASARGSDEVGQALRTERANVERLVGELASAKREIETQTANLSTANEEAAKTKAANAQTIDQLQRALQDERDKAQKLRGEVDAIAQEKDAQVRAASDERARMKEASARAAEEGRQALQAEQEKAKKLAGELDRAKSELDDLAKAKASAEVVQKTQLEELRQKLEREVAATATARDATEAERVRRQQLEQQLASRPESQTVHRTASVESPTQVVGQATPVVATVPGGGKTPAAAPGDRPSGTMAARPAPPSVQADAETVRLLARASLLLEQGNIAAARNMLDRAAETGSPEAVFALAETYDPVVLAARQTFGTQSDAGKARELYEKALAGGIGEARARLDALRK